MKKSFYPGLAFQSIKKNRKIYFPYILTCIGIVMMHNIVSTLSEDELLYVERGREFVKIIMNFGKWVIAVFAFIFLFYTYSFIIRRRKKEFGLYNILGMEKKNIARILFWETLITAVISLGAGILFSIVFYKAAELCMMNMLGGDLSYDFQIFPNAILNTVEVFGILFVILFLSSVGRVKFLNSISLLKSENVGEKPPKGNIIFAIIGLVMLGAAYYGAVTIDNPIQALNEFVIAVIIVIIATYLIMISGSVVFCRLLKKNKKYYYRSNHFVSVSSMAYRMKRNGAGLASICILATMVLVTVAMTSCLYFGNEDIVNVSYPREINVSISTNSVDGLSDDIIEPIKKEISKTVKNEGAKTDNIYEFRCAFITGLTVGDTVEVDSERVNRTGISYSDLISFQFMNLSDYNRMMGSNETLKQDEALFFSDKSYDYDSISFRGGNTFKIKTKDSMFSSHMQGLDQMVSVGVIVVPNIKEAIDGLKDMKLSSGNSMMTYYWDYFFDTGLDEEAQIELSKNIEESISEYCTKNSLYSELIDFDEAASRASNRGDIFSLCAGLFSIGIALSVVFLFGAVLIIYYKQVSEGYEDQSRFDIMQKVGMTKKEIRKSINSQLLTVFFLPLIFAGCHLIFAFPFIQKMLICFKISNTPLLIFVTALSFVIFALFYVFVYKITSNSYYHIVSDAKNKE